MVTNEYNNMDYYGPVQVTGVELEINRPNQQIDKFNPKYFYYYQLVQTLEWGDSWGCPGQKSETWCSVNEDLYKNKCRVQINCNGHPAVGLGECATAEGKQKAYATHFKCWASTAQNEGLLFQRRRRQIL